MPMPVAGPPHTLALVPGWEAIAWALDILSVGLAVYWSIALYRLVRTLRSVPTARAGLSLPPSPEPAPSVCAVIPAHNEEAHIGPLVASLRAQDYPRLGVVLCLDRCTDGTAEAARRAAAGDPRVEIVEIDACPEGWAGKVNAAWRGAQTPRARAADLLLFADADTQLDPACTRACVALLRRRSLDLLSLLSTLSCDRWFERLAQPAAGLELVRQYPIRRANRWPHPRAFANGQFMLFRREAYDALGGHGAVKDELLEDLALARHLGESGRRPGLFVADGLLRCRMYDSWPAFRDGWKRIYIEAAKRKPGRLRHSALVTLVTGFLLPAAALANAAFSVALATSNNLDARGAGHIGLALAAAALAPWLSVLLSVYRLGGTPLWTVPLAPIGSWLTSRILAQAAGDLRRRVPIRWAGREYIREPR